MCVCVCVCVCVFMYGGSDSKGSACNVRDQGLIPGLGRSPGRGNGNPLQYSCLENPMDRVTKSLTQLKLLSMQVFLF